jgi:predicted short-subunit dehydrogenase-like oxidoreductase (DUF2520 family)
VPLQKPTRVSRAADLLLLTVPDDMLSNVVTMLAASGAIRRGQYVAHTSGRHGLAVLQPAADLGAHVLTLHPANHGPPAVADAARPADRLRAQQVTRAHA